MLTSTRSENNEGLSDFWKMRSESCQSNMKQNNSTIHSFLKIYYNNVPLDPLRPHNCPSVTLIRGVCLPLNPLVLYSWFHIAGLLFDIPGFISFQISDSIFQVLDFISQISDLIFQICQILVVRYFFGLDIETSALQVQLRDFSLITLGS